MIDKLLLRTLTGRKFQISEPYEVYVLLKFLWRDIALAQRVSNAEAYAQLVG
jgi:hypothetical protein